MAFGPEIPTISTQEEYIDYTSNLKVITYNYVRRLAVQYKHHILNADATYNNLLRGAGVINDIDYCAIYLVAYGIIHKNNLDETFKKIPSSIFESEIDIVDWGCGQGLATIILAEHIEGLKNNIKTVTLIDPSVIALKQAEIYVKQFLPQASIVCHSKSIDDLKNNCFDQCNCNTRLHLFANIIDVDNINLKSLAGLIKLNSTSNEYYVCLSPAYNLEEDNCFKKSKCTNNCRLTQFIKYLGCPLVYDRCTPRDTAFDRKTKGRIIKIGGNGILSSEELKCDQYKCYHKKKPAFGYLLTSLGLTEWPDFKRGYRRGGGTYYKVTLVLDGTQIEAKSDNDLQDEALQNCVLLKYDPFGDNKQNYYRIVKRTNLQCRDFQ